MFIVPTTAVSPCSMLRRVTIPVDGRLDPDLAEVGPGVLERGLFLAYPPGLGVEDAFRLGEQIWLGKSASSLSARSNCSRACGQAPLPQSRWPLVVVLRQLEAGRPSSRA